MPDPGGFFSVINDRAKGLDSSGVDYKTLHRKYEGLRAAEAGELWSGPRDVTWAAEDPGKGSWRSPVFIGRFWRPRHGLRTIVLASQTSRAVEPLARPGDSPFILTSYGVRFLSTASQLRQPAEGLSVHSCSDHSRIYARRLHLAHALRKGHGFHTEAIAVQAAGARHVETVSKVSCGDNKLDTRTEGGSPLSLCEPFVTFPTWGFEGSFRAANET